MGHGRIAGHIFKDTINGPVCLEPRTIASLEICGQHWLAICDATDTDLNKEGMAHFGKLNSSELAEIRTEVKVRAAAKKLRDDLIWGAVQGAGGHDRTPTPSAPSPVEEDHSQWY